MAKAMKAYYIGIAMLIITLQIAVLIAERRHGHWMKVSAKETDGFGPLYFTQSSIACGIQCSSFPGCYEFCYNNVTSTCYLKTKTSLGMTLPVDAIVQCYKRRCSFSTGYFPYSGRCIQFFTNKLSYQAARQRCEQDGAHLFHFKTKEDKQPLIDVMRDNGLEAITAESLVWIGADDINQEGIFLWSDGDVLSNDSDLWSDANPDTYLGGHEDCVQVNPNYLFNNLQCDSSLFYICQLDLWP